MTPLDDAVATITSWCATEAAVRGQDHAAATYAESVPAAATYTAGGLGAPPGVLELDEEDIALLAELADQARARLDTWRRTGWLSPADREKLLFTARAALAGAPHEDPAAREAATASLEALEQWCAQAPAEPPAEPPAADVAAPGEAKAASGKADVEEAPVQGELFALPG
ncbi:hypothetical protein [Amycolatopsis albispora]|uniref:Uncharacterized protein n=1 Tax=Amycolatopsis albispora TaxID=1804986 RepID=A0A344L209_9PSEU|nr:hypothetical protein [Amycolatopsis albispora]AXB42083.1 hypothetical protein A4R43_05700 [Amycolatopsis albispora]